MTYPKVVPSGEDIIAYTAGASNLGNAGHWFGAVYTNNLITESINGTNTDEIVTRAGSVSISGNINMLGAQITGIGLTLIAGAGSNLNLNAGGSVHASGSSVSIEATGSVAIKGSVINTVGALVPLTSSGTDDIGSTSHYFGTIYANKVVQTGVSSAGAGTIVGPVNTTNSGIAIWSNTTGTALANSQFLITNSNLLPANSGTQSLGSLSNPMNLVYTNFISGTAQVAKAWVLWNQETGTPTISGSHNVSSLTDVGVGITTVNFITPMPDSKFAAVGNVSNAGGNIAVMMPQLLMTTGVKVTTSNTLAFLDYKYNSLAVHSNP